MFLSIIFQCLESHSFASLLFLAEIKSIIGRRNSSFMPGMVSSNLSSGCGSISSYLKSGLKESVYIRSQRFVVFGNFFFPERLLCACLP